MSKKMHAVGPILSVNCLILGIKGGTGPALALFIDDQVDKPVPKGIIASPNQPRLTG